MSSDMQSLAEEYRHSADLVADRIDELREELKTARGQEAFGLQRRIDLLRQELDELMWTYKYLVKNYVHDPGAQIRAKFAARRWSRDGW